ncbi:hypothetical protein H9Q74_005008 [Fusarium xylarioides]|nr:hypothetical protein H9Q71_004857 [Fusarium xylarioides]KAG5824874.1 hypothetical protein H9Q74_005008 [Fusarium xylarioides]
MSSNISNDGPPFSFDQFIKSAQYLITHGQPFGFNPNAGQPEESAPNNKASPHEGVGSESPSMVGDPVPDDPVPDGPDNPDDPDDNDVAIEYLRRIEQVSERTFHALSDIRELFEQLLSKFPLQNPENLSQRHPTPGPTHIPPASSIPTDGIPSYQKGPNFGAPDATKNPYYSRKRLLSELGDER